MISNIQKLESTLVEIVIHPRNDDNRENSKSLEMPFFGTCRYRKKQKDFIFEYDYETVEQNTNECNEIRYNFLVNTKEQVVNHREQVEFDPDLNQLVNVVCIDRL